MEFNKLLANINIELSDRQLEQFEIYFKFLVEYNQYVNLTAITEEEDVYIKHFYDTILSGILGNPAPLPTSQIELTVVKSNTWPTKILS